MNVADITISLIYKSLNMSLYNYLTETLILSVSFPSCCVYTTKQNFNPNLCTKIKSKGPVSGLTLPNKNDNPSACKTVSVIIFCSNSYPATHAQSQTTRNSEYGSVWNSTV